eukprot:8848903-Ditylum_brightwellii.AAC.1
MVKLNKLNGRTSHIGIHPFAIEDWIEKGNVKLLHIQGAANPSDALTKALGWMLHRCHDIRIVGHM